MQAWAIRASGGGLYSGTASSRRLAIAQHVYTYNAALYERGFPMWQNKPLDDLQKKIWKSCCERGDAAVKVTIKINDK